MRGNVCKQTEVEWNHASVWGKRKDPNTTLPVSDVQVAYGCQRVRIQNYRITTPYPHSYVLSETEIEVKYGITK